MTCVFKPLFPVFIPHPFSLHPPLASCDFWKRLAAAFWERPKQSSSGWANYAQAEHFACYCVWDSRLIDWMGSNEAGERRARKKPSAPSVPRPDRLIHPRAHVGQHIQERRACYSAQMWNHISCERRSTLTHKSTATQPSLSGYKLRECEQWASDEAASAEGPMWKSHSHHLFHSGPLPGRATCSGRWIDTASSIDKKLSAVVLADVSLIFLLPAELTLHGCLEPHEVDEVSSE